MNASEFDDKSDMSSRARFVLADMLARPWLVRARLRSSFALTMATAMIRAPARRRDAPVRRHHPGYLMQYAGWR